MQTRATSPHSRTSLIFYPIRRFDWILCPIFRGFTDLRKQHIFYLMSSINFCARAAAGTGNVVTYHFPGLLPSPSQPPPSSLPSSLAHQTSSQEACHQTHTYTHHMTSLLGSHDGITWWYYLETLTLVSFHAQECEWFGKKVPTNDYKKKYFNVLMVRGTIIRVKT